MRQDYYKFYGPAVKSACSRIEYTRTYSQTLSRVQPSVQSWRVLLLWRSVVPHQVYGMVMVLSTDGWRVGDKQQRALGDAERQEVRGRGQ